MLCIICDKEAVYVNHNSSRCLEHKDTIVRKSVKKKVLEFNPEGYKLCMKIIWEKWIVNGIKYKIDKVDGNLVKLLLGMYSPEVVCAMLDLFWTMNDEWIKENMGRSVKSLYIKKHRLVEDSRIVPLSMKYRQELANMTKVEKNGVFEPFKGNVASLVTLKSIPMEASND